MGNNSIKSNICFNKIKKNSYQIIFSLYHLNISCFKYDQEQGFYAYHYCKRYGTYKVTLKIRISDNDFFKIFNKYYHMFTAEGDCENFNVVITSDPVGTTRFNKEIIFTLRGKTHPIIYSCEFSGIIPMKIKNSKRRTHSKYGKPFHASYNTSQWAINHPYSGGRFTPK